MRLTAVVVVVLGLLVSVAMGTHQARDAITRVREFETARSDTGAPADTTAWEDDMESEDTGWTHDDMTATAVPHFHTDTYMAYQGGTSWWCGTFDYDEDGGYGNNWDDRLDVPPTDWTGYTYPVLRFWERHDSETDYDFTYVQAESSGVWISMNRGYHNTTTWDRKEYYLGWYDNPAVIRFRFVSDGAWSDEDGNNTVGGAFICDNIEIIDYVTTDVLFWDDVESGGLCTPSVPGAAGDYWEVIENDCQAYSDPHVWSAAHPETNAVEPNLQNWLQTPFVDISEYEPVNACTLWTVFQFWIPGPSADGWTEQVTTDGGATWNTSGAWYGNQCDYGYGPCDHFLFYIDLTPWLPATGDVAVRWILQSDDDGISPDPLCSYESVGITIDDTWFQVNYTEMPPGEEVLIYPNPYRYDSGGDGVTIAVGGSGEGVKVKIYDMFTALVRDLTDDVDEKSGEVVWDIENDDGKVVASGMYLLTIDDGDDVVTERIMVIK